MQSVKDLRSILKAKNAKWMILPEIDDNKSVKDISREFRLGALPARIGAPTARLPRMRLPEDGKYYLWKPNVHSRYRIPVNQLPKSWDWRNVNNSNWITPVRDQGSCGSCVAHAVAAAAEAHQRIENNQPNLTIDLSEASLFFVNNRQCNLGDPNYGWWIATALDFLVDEGICFEENYPYRDINQTALLIEGSIRTLKIKGYDSSSSAKQMKRWLCEDGPIVTSFDVYGDFNTFFYFGSGIYTQTWGNYRGSHAVCVIGYDDAQSCWICKNSWGASNPHQDGCFLIGYGECKIDNRMYTLQDIYDVYTVDELPYNPNNLQIIDEGPNGWLLTDGISRMKIFDNKEDARNGLAIARRHNRQGFIGRDNARGTNRPDYITEYWSGNSGLPYTPLTKTDAIPYNPNNVIAEDLDAQGWRIRDGNHWMLLANDMNDALAILKVVERYSRMCFIGRENNRPNRKAYIMTYWE